MLRFFGANQLLNCGSNSKYLKKKNKKTYDQTKGAHKEAIQGFRDVSASVRWWNVHSTLTGSEVRP
jgi:hypothetical protein